MVLVGAQAVYLRTADRLRGYKTFTTDADIVVDPALLTDQPALGDVMRKAGFVHSNEPGVWKSAIQTGAASTTKSSCPSISSFRCTTPLDPNEGRHGSAPSTPSMARRKSEGLEGALVDHSPTEIRAINPADNPSVVVNVAGEAALLVAKLHNSATVSRSPNVSMPKTPATCTGCSTSSRPTIWRRGWRLCCATDDRRPQLRRQSRTAICSSAR